jgi:hypothetical protein
LEPPIEAARRLKAVESSFGVKTDASSLADRRSAAEICLAFAVLERAGLGVDVMLNVLCPEGFH